MISEFVNKLAVFRGNYYKRCDWLQEFEIPMTTISQGQATYPASTNAGLPIGQSSSSMNNSIISLRSMGSYNGQNIGVEEGIQRFISGDF